MAITTVAVVYGQGLDILLLPLIGVPAAVAASLVTTTLLLIPYAREVRRRFGEPLQAGYLLRPLACACAAAVPALAFNALVGSSSGRVGVMQSEALA